MPIADIMREKFGVRAVTDVLIVFLSLEPRVYLSKKFFASLLI